MKKGVALLLALVLALGAVGISAFAVNTPLPGDANGDGKVSVADCVCIMQYVVDNTRPIEKEGDVNQADGITAQDALLIARYLAGGYDVELLPAPEVPPIDPPVTPGKPGDNEGPWDGDWDD